MSCKTLSVRNSNTYFQEKQRKMQKGEQTHVANEELDDFVKAAREMLKIPSFAEVLAVERREKVKKCRCCGQQKTRRKLVSITANGEKNEGTSTESDGFYSDGNQMAESGEHRDNRRRLPMPSNAQLMQLYHDFGTMKTSAPAHRQANTDSRTAKGSNFNSKGRRLVPLRRLDVVDRDPKFLIYEDSSDTDISNFSNGFYSDEDVTEKAHREWKLADMKRRRLEFHAVRGIQM